MVIVGNHAEGVTGTGSSLTSPSSGQEATFSNKTSYFAYRYALRICLALFLEGRGQALRDPLEHHFVLKTTRIISYPCKFVILAPKTQMPGIFQGMSPVGFRMNSSKFVLTRPDVFRQ